MERNPIEDLIAQVTQQQRKKSNLEQRLSAIILEYDKIQQQILFYNEKKASIQRQVQEIKSEISKRQATVKQLQAELSEQQVQKKQ